MSKTKLFNILYKGRKFDNYELLKSAKLSTGFTVYLFRGAICPKLFNYVVCARRGDETIEFHSLMQCSHPFSMYLDLICCYA